MQSEPIHMTHASESAALLLPVKSVAKRLRKLIRAGLRWMAGLVHAEPTAPAFHRRYEEKKTCPLGLSTVAI
jgi:hypothetical protein